MRIAVEGVRADLWCRTCESVVPGRSRSTTARDLPANDCSRVSSGVDSEVESRPASADFESLTLRSRVVRNRLPAAEYNYGAWIRLRISHELNLELYWLYLDLHSAPSFVYLQ